MEFFREVAVTHCDVDELQAKLTIATLPDFCSSIDNVLSADQGNGEIYCLWGAFNIRRDPIRQGVRFSLLNCPHALAWTVTCKAENKLLIHCTIDDREVDEEFAESIHQFVDDWETGLARIQEK
jgi:hypothetical protein